jgi:RNA polymerase sigma factor (sigma-70 family)
MKQDFNEWMASIGNIYYSDNRLMSQAFEKIEEYEEINYVRYKEDLKKSMPDDKFYDYYTRDELIVKFLPLVENLARKFSTTQQASGVLSINDLIQIGSEGLIKAVDKLDWLQLSESEDIEKTLKSFFSKRIKGNLRRRIDINRGDIRIPEHKLNEIRNNPKDKKLVEMFFNSVFLSIDSQVTDDNDENIMYQVPDKSEPYNIQLMNVYLKSLMQKYLNENEYEVLRLSYGLDCDKHSAKEIANILKIEGVSSYVRVSELKKQAVQKLIDNVDHSQVIDIL